MSTETPAPSSSSPPAPAAPTDELSREETLDWHLTHKDDFAEAQRLKTEGNKCFVANAVEDAINLYREGLAFLPSRPPPEKGKGKARALVDEDEAKEEAEDEEVEDDLSLPLSPEVRDLRAALHANVAACHIKASRWQEAVDWCTEALGDDPTYVKALQRRATANEKLGTWTSLSAALEDQKTLFSLPNLPAAQTSQAKAALSRLPPLVEKRKEAETAEMMSKLKNLGNSLLGKFGMSTDNFKMTPNGEGGYSMNFVR